MFKLNVEGNDGDYLGEVELSIVPSKDDVFYVSDRVARVEYRRITKDNVTLIVTFID